MVRLLTAAVLRQQMQSETKSETKTSTLPKELAAQLQKTVQVMNMHVLLVGNKSAGKTFVLRAVKGKQVAAAQCHCRPARRHQRC